MLVYILGKKTPGLSQMLADMGQPSAAQLADALGVSVRTAARWIEADTAPRPAMLALYWVTRWGRDEVDCTAGNDARRMHALAQCEKRRADLAEQQRDMLLLLGDFGAANDVLKDARPVVAAAAAAARATRAQAHQDRVTDCRRHEVDDYRLHK